MHESLKQETDKLVRSWANHEPAWLGSYLVSGVEDPRINLQSILSRHFLIRELSGEFFIDLMAQECRFGAAMNWLTKLLKPSANPDEMAALLYALQRGSDNAEGQEIPFFLVQAFAQLPAFANGLAIPNYIECFLSQGVGLDGQVREIQLTLNCFQELWRKTLNQVNPIDHRALTVNSNQSSRVSLIEPACGSANDYRFLRAYGLAQWIDYDGFDLCEKNIVNARALFPDARFHVGNAFAIDSADKAYDLCLVHDLLEHLSIEGMQTAVREICRVTRRGICVGFFQMDEISEHVVRPVDDYHCNLLSMTKMRALFAQHGFVAQVIHIGTFLEQQVGCEDTYNPNAYTFLLRPRD